MTTEAQQAEYKESATDEDLDSRDAKTAETAEDGVNTCDLEPLAVEGRPKWKAKYPKRFTFSGPRKDKRRRTQQKGKEEDGCDDVGHSIVEPFSLDPSRMPAAELIKKTSESMHSGLLKNHKKSNDRKYKVEYEELTVTGSIGEWDDASIDRKSWYYALYFPGNWLSDLHVELGMYFLRMKAEQYKLKQKFTTADTMFMHLLKKNYDTHITNATTLADTALNRNIMGIIFGTHLDYALPWAEADIVYMPLNNVTTGSLWY
ncbi:unnamed protein product [Cuscuta europaea]|uniref:Uncharacterized protein n=1 Tax=Cuscuta europaea TaxID=41803 RepID=A0A9P0ZY37_CUSEU|nr:unnamed protein product [Cuscuta europaea]